MHRAGEDVVRALALIHIVIGMHPARHPPFAAQQLTRAIRQHLVDVHVALCPRSGLPHHQGKRLRVLTRQHLIGRLAYRRRLLGTQQAKLPIDLGRRPFDPHQGVDQGARHFLVGDTKMRQRALRLCAPQLLRRDGDLPHRVAFSTIPRHPPFLL